MGFPDPKRVLGFLYPLHPKRVADRVLSSSDKVYNPVVTPYIHHMYLKVPTTDLPHIRFRWNFFRNQSTVGMQHQSSPSVRPFLQHWDIPSSITRGLHPECISMVGGSWVIEKSISKKICCSILTLDPFPGGSVDLKIMNTEHLELELLMLPVLPIIKGKMDTHIIYLPSNQQWLACNVGILRSQLVNSPMTPWKSKPRNKRIRIMDLFITVKTLK